LCVCVVVRCAAGLIQPHLCIHTQDPIYMSIRHCFKKNQDQKKIHPVNNIFVACRWNDVPIERQRKPAVVSKRQQRSSFWCPACEYH
jgi:hypothetical protein